MRPEPGKIPWKKYLLSGGLYCAVMSYALGLTVFGPMVSRMAGDLGVSEASTGALFVWMSAGFLGATAAGWRYSHRISLKAFALAGAAGLAAGLALISRGRSYPEVAVGIGLFGIGGAWSEIAGNAAIADLFPSRRTMALNIYHFTFGAAALAGPRFSGLLIADGTGWRTVYLCVAAVALLPLPVFAVSRFPGPAPDPDGRDAVAVGPVWHNPVIIAVALGIFFYVGAEIGTNNWAALFLQRARGFDEFESAAAVSNFWLALTAGRLLVIYFATRVMAERLLLSLTAGVVISSGLLAFEPSGAGLWMVALGGCFSGVFATLFAIATNRFPARSTAVSTVLTAAAGSGILVLAPAIGYANQWLGHSLGFGVTFIYSLALFACGGWLAMYSRKTA